MKLKNFRYALIAALVCHAAMTSYAQEQYSLEDCKRIALENNKKIKASNNEIEASRALHKSVSANALPKLEGSVVGAHFGSPMGGALNGMIPEQFANGTVTLSQPIYAGGKIRYGKQTAAKGIEIQEERKNIATVDLLADVEKSYWQVVQVNEKIILAKRFKEMLLVLHRDLKNSFDAGLIYKNDLLRVEVTSERSGTKPHQSKRRTCDGKAEPGTNHGECRQHGVRAVGFSDGQLYRVVFTGLCISR